MSWITSQPTSLSNNQQSERPTSYAIYILFSTTEQTRQEIERLVNQDSQVQAAEANQTGSSSENQHTHAIVIPQLNINNALKHGRIIWVTENPVLDNDLDFAIFHHGLVIKAQNARATHDRDETRYHEHKFIAIRQTYAAAHAESGFAKNQNDQNHNENEYTRGDELVVFIVDTDFKSPIPMRHRIVHLEVPLSGAARRLSEIDRNLCSWESMANRIDEEVKDTQIPEPLMDFQQDFVLERTRCIRLEAFMDVGPLSSSPMQTTY